MLTCDELFFCNKSHHKTRLCPLTPGVSIYPPQRQEATSPFVYFRLFPFSDLYWVCLSVFSCTVLFVSISQVIGCEDRLRNDLYTVSSGALNSTPTPTLLALPAPAEQPSRVCETVLSLSVPSGRCAPLLRVCCCEPSRQERSIDCCTAGAQQQPLRPNAKSASLSAEHRLV